MTKHVKHDDSVDIQVRTKILDEYGNPIEGAIEYDPSTGFGKKIVDPALGLTAPFFRKGGSIEIEGHNFSEENHDPTEVDAIREMITLKVSRNDPAFDDMLKAKINQKRDEDKAAHPASAGPRTEPDQPLNLAKLKFVAVTQIAKGEKVDVDPDTGEVSGTRSKNVFTPDPKNQANDLQWANKTNPDKRTSR